MPSLSFVSSGRTDRSFQIGLTLVIFFAIAEIFLAGFHYVSKMRPASTAVASRTMPAPLPSIAPSAPPVALPIAQPSAALTPPTSVASEADRLLKQAQSEKDTASALARLQAASERDPKNPELLAEIASIYELTQNFDRSAETWRRVLEIGPSGGALYDLADMKLKTGVPTSTSATPPLTGSALDAGKTTTVAEVTGVRSTGTAEGIPQGSMLGISEVTASETPDPDAETNLMLRIAVKKRPSAVIDHTKVKIQVYFYDTVGDNDIKLTDADVSYEWLTPNHDWAESNSETLAVTYIRPKSKTKSAESDLAAAAAAINPAKKGKPIKASPPPESSNRKYLGYIVRVYYNDQLQDKRAEPNKLLTLFPAPYTAPPQ
jgi:tetratricopeptide (TPR) repeat protein